MRNSVSPARVRCLILETSFQLTQPRTDIAAVGKKVVEFYEKKGGDVVSPLVKAFHL